ncbi:hypothetical protein PFAG_04248 [Plasmodium falciparum Santa Lucia]|uniref:Uncharacterized protein n=5 Tax=Plasmodium falciparum TaxID=5833 RepID=A0A024W2D2_PLAFA|nr:hypothetical protein PFFVO_03852 [Plasmodium falciparum Vietnam Oak-Knoll (FVO)]ETW35089.1 hypothetical protein PFTANZ_04215 [Plasmodium falciparum Tanzania (2000708)]ETW41168.1 hypothetical protein PFNF135_04409 [Plasmodium falciparum NF135/5.C10]ETW59754.1 hypothetical protein PFMC_04216 [Plasmodium falciparum CAMP/Malaysia]EUT81029.1 hypothetical protein PFAG_04248 [Plasmodium falciparum Santa Lucia]
MSYKIFLKTFNEEKNKETYINKKYVQNIKIKETFSLKKQNILFKLWHNTNDICKNEEKIYSDQQNYRKT